MDKEAVRRIGEIADATGLTVRTLHYYEEIGLLEATCRSEAGHRLYGTGAVEQLYRISMLRQLGLPLGQVRATLSTDETDVRSLIADHLAVAFGDKIGKPGVQDGGTAAQHLVDSRRHFLERGEAMQDVMGVDPLDRVHVRFLGIADERASFRGIFHQVVVFHRVSISNPRIHQPAEQVSAGS